MDQHYHRCRSRIIAALFLLFLCFGAKAQVDTPDSAGAVEGTLQTKDALVVPQDKDSALPLPPPRGVDAHLYRMNYWVSGGFSLVATAANAYAIPNLIKSKSEITPKEIQGLNPDAFNGFERWAFRQNPGQAEQLDKNSDYILQGIIVGTAALGLDKAIRRDALRLLMLYYETHAVTFTLYNFSFFGPLFQNKYRPIVYYTELPLDARNGGNNKNSQYSGHTASAAASTFFMAKVYNDYHPEFSSGKKYLIYGLASIPPLIEGYYRMAAMKHFPSDILIGFLIGATCGVVVPEMHRFKRQAIRVGLAATPVGPGLSMTWRPGQKSIRISRLPDLLGQRPSTSPIPNVPFLPGTNSAANTAPSAKPSRL